MFNLEGEVTTKRKRYEVVQVHCKKSVISPSNQNTCQYPGGLGTDGHAMNGISSRLVESLESRRRRAMFWGPSGAARGR